MGERHGQVTHIYIYIGSCLVNHAQKQHCLNKVLEYTLDFLLHLSVSMWGPLQVAYLIGTMTFSELHLLSFAFLWYCFLCPCRWVSGVILNQGVWGCRIVEPARVKPTMSVAVLLRSQSSGTDCWSFPCAGQWVGFNGPWLLPPLTCKWLNQRLCEVQEWAIYNWILW